MCKNLGLQFDLPNGFKIGGEHTKAVELLSSNSIAEEVFTKKLPQQPFTWIGNVISVAVGSIGNVNVGDAVRQEYFKTGKVTIPNIVKQIPFADANSLLLEIHRRVWAAEVKNQETLCRFCSKSIEIDINLNNIDLTDAQKLLLEENPEPEAIVVVAETPFKLASLLRDSKREEISELADITFNRLVFRIPTLGDAIKNQEYFDKNIDFWRRIGADCLIAIQSVDENDNVTADIPEQYLKLISIKIYKELSADILKSIRHELREALPVIPFSYMDDCACDMQRKIPYALDSSGFFSE